VSEDHTFPSLENTLHTMYAIEALEDFECDHYLEEVARLRAVDRAARAFLLAFRNDDHEANHETVRAAEGLIHAIALGKMEEAQP
jgi:demethoxyubiquinone hydroxylase (CLK1/Coq7/Cat5 family)